MVTTTPKASDTMGLRMLCVYGSQTKTCERLTKKMAEAWKQQGVVSSVAVFEGNTLAHESEDLASLKNNYDVKCQPAVLNRARAPPRSAI